ncbi:hypothetical protein DIE07_18745 [Burkholderia sp. Bp9002]|nr:hypothetical protein DIE07_18745 [Burkholderia sp. Bp9002]
MVPSRFDSVSSGCAGCVPACIVDSKVTSHIRAKATAGDIFLTGCDYAEKPLGRVGALSGGLFGRVLERGRLSRCVGLFRRVDLDLADRVRIMRVLSRPRRIT